MSFTEKGEPGSPACSFDYGFDATYYTQVGKSPLSVGERERLAHVYAAWIRSRGTEDLHAALVHGQIKKKLAELSPDSTWERLALPYEK